MALRSHRDFQTYLRRIETTGSRLNECDTRLRQESEAETVATRRRKAGRKEKEWTLAKSKEVKSQGEGEEV